MEKDTTNRFLGGRQQVCRICGAKGRTREEFPYFECGRCHCLQIAEVPENLGDYYGEDYYSYQVGENPDMKFAEPVRNRSKILDVGCGAGAWLLEMAGKGYGNLYGCDPFLG